MQERRKERRAMGYEWLVEGKSYKTFDGERLRRDVGLHRVFRLASRDFEVGLVDDFVIKQPCVGREKIRKRNFLPKKAFRGMRSLDFRKKRRERAKLESYVPRDEDGEIRYREFNDHARDCATLKRDGGAEILDNSTVFFGLDLPADQMFIYKPVETLGRSATDRSASDVNRSAYRQGLITSQREFGEAIRDYYGLNVEDNKERIATGSDVSSLPAGDAPPISSGQVSTGFELPVVSSSSKKKKKPQRAHFAL